MYVYFLPKQVSILIDLNKMTQYSPAVENNERGKMTKKVHPKVWKQWNVKVPTANFLSSTVKLALIKLKIKHKSSLKCNWDKISKLWEWISQTNQSVSYPSRAKPM